MKKIVLLTGMILMASNMANACEGISTKGNSGADYCLSHHNMNWYSAYTWCQTQGMNLIDLETVCGSNTKTCSELRLSEAEKNHILESGGKVSDVWTNTSYSEQYAYFTNLSSGQTLSGYSHYRDNRHNYPVYALCQ